MAFSATFSQHVGEQSLLDGGVGGELSCPTELDAQSAVCLDNYIKKAVPSSPLYGKGVTFVSAGQKYDVNPALMVAIGQQESLLGTRGAVNSHPHNYFGMTKKGGGYRSFTSWEEAINYHADYLYRVYLKEGRDTIEKIGEKYCPIGAENDPYGLNKHWVPGVKRNFKAIITQCPAFGQTTILAGKCGQAIIQQAAKYKNIVYGVYGSHCGPATIGRSSDNMKIDCSGFTSRVYRDLGLAPQGWCETTATILAGDSNLVEIPASQIQQGDLIVSFKPGQQRHVVIYVSGDVNVNSKFTVWHSGQCPGGASKVCKRTRKSRAPDQKYFRAKKCLEK